MFNELKIFGQHGIQYVPDVRNVKLTPLFRGRPEIQSSLTHEEAEKLHTLCPVGAFLSSPVAAIDLGKCVFCKECSFLLPEKVIFTNDYKMATNNAQDLVVKCGETNSIALRHNEIRSEIRSFFGGALKLRQISAGGDNSCEMELNAAGNVNFDMGRWGIEFVASPRHADGIVITGPISANMAEALQICYEAIPHPKIIILAGTDAISGGIFADSMALDRSFLSKYPVDLYVPGNPVHPLTFINGVLDLIGNKKGR
jgi:Ni,Fe-hydrogenase III small subunit